MCTLHMLNAYTVYKECIHSSSSMYTLCTFKVYVINIHHLQCVCSRHMLHKYQHIHIQCISIKISLHIFLLEPLLNLASKLSFVARQSVRTLITLPAFKLNIHDQCTPCIYMEHVLHTSDLYNGYVEHICYINSKYMPHTFNILCVNISVYVHTCVVKCRYLFCEFYPTA